MDVCEPKPLVRQQTICKRAIRVKFRYRGSSATKYCIGLRGCATLQCEGRSAPVENCLIRTNLLAIPPVPATPAAPAPSATATPPPPPGRHVRHLHHRRRHSTTSATASAAAFTLWTRFVHHERATEKSLPLRAAIAFSASASSPTSAKPKPRGWPVKRSRSSVSESGCTPISENSAYTCSSVALNDRLPTYSFFKVVLLVPPVNEGTREAEEAGSRPSASVRLSGLKRALQRLSSILLQLPAVNNGGSARNGLTPWRSARRLRMQFGRIGGRMCRQFHTLEELLCAG